MKNIYILLLLSLCLASCNGKRAARETTPTVKTPGESIRASLLPLTDEQRVILDSLKHIIYGPDGYDTTTDRVPSLMPPEEFERLDFYALPYYEMNCDYFVAHPKAKSLLRRLDKAREDIYYIGLQDGEIASNLRGWRVIGGWIPALKRGNAKYFAEHFSWLPEEIAKSDDGKCFVLNAFGRDFLVFRQAGEPLFVDDVRHRKYNKEEVCAMMVKRIDGYLVFKEWLAGHGLTFEALRNGAPLPPGAPMICSYDYE
jgi:hypothetical protein